MPGSETRKVVDADGCEARGRQEHAESIARLRTIKVGERQLVAIYSPKRARKDARDRERRIQRLSARLAKGASPASQSNRGTARFLDFPEGQASLNQDKIVEAARWDGLRGIVAWSCDDMAPPGPDHPLPEVGGI